MPGESSILGRNFQAQENVFPSRTHKCASALTAGAEATYRLPLPSMPGMADSPSLPDTKG